MQMTVAERNFAHLPTALTGTGTRLQWAVADAAAAMQVRQSLPMAQLTRISVEPPAADGREVVELTFASGTITGDTKWTHEVDSAGDRTLLVRALYLFAS